MKPIKFLFLVLAPAILTLLDTSFFANMPIKNVTIVSVFQIAIFLALLANSKNYFLFVAFSTISFAIFSSLPVWLIFILFFAIPSGVMYLRKNFIPLPSAPFSLIFFAAANFLFETLLLLYAKEWSGKGLSTVAYFVLINTIFGGAIYGVYKFSMDSVLRNRKIRIS